MSTETIEDPEFGLLQWDARLAEWSGQSTMIDGTPFQLSVRTPSDSQPPKIVATNPDKTITPESRAIFRKIRHGDAHIRAKAGSKYAVPHFESYDGEIISTEDFQIRLQLDAVAVKANGEAEVYYLNDDLLSGHAIIVSLRPDGTAYHVQTFG
jgi:hypothetical protein